MLRTMTIAVIVGSVTSMLVSCSTAPKAKTSPVAQTPNPSAEAVLKQMAQVYASVKSYSDSGLVTYYHNNERDEASISFQIHYARPDHLRFDMTANIGSSHFPEEHKVFWSDGKATYSWWQSDAQLHTWPSVMHQISGFTGISGRSAHNIPSLLQTNFGWQEYLNKITSPKFLGDETFERVNCFRIQGGGRGKRQFEIWIGKSDLLIRKIRTTYPTFTNEEIHRDIIVNQTIPLEMLTFTPPKSIDNHGKD